MRRFFFTIIAFIFTFPLSAQQWAMSTNLAGWAGFGTMNVEAAYSPAQHWTVDAGVKYNPFTFGKDDSQFQQRQQTWWAGARWWPWHSYAGWWVSAKLQYQEYNVGGLVSDKTEEGDKVGLGATAGYTYMLGPHLNLEFGLGLWSGWKWYTVYACPKCGMTVDGGKKAFVLPNDFMISISYIF